MKRRLGGLRNFCMAKISSVPLLIRSPFFMVLSLLCKSSFLDDTFYVWDSLRESLAASSGNYCKGSLLASLIRQFPLAAASGWLSVSLAIIWSSSRSIFNFYAFSSSYFSIVDIFRSTSVPSRLLAVNESPPRVYNKLVKLLTFP